MKRLLIVAAALLLTACSYVEVSDIAVAQLHCMPHGGLLRIKQTDTVAGSGGRVRIVEYVCEDKTVNKTTYKAPQ